MNGKEDACVTKSLIPIKYESSNNKAQRHSTPISYAAHAKYSYSRLYNFTVVRSLFFLHGSLSCSLYSVHTVYIHILERCVVIFVVSEAIYVVHSALYTQNTAHTQRWAWTFVHYSTFVMHLTILGGCCRAHDLQDCKFRLRRTLNKHRKLLSVEGWRNLLRIVSKWSIKDWLTIVAKIVKQG